MKPEDATPHSWLRRLMDIEGVSDDAAIRFGADLCAQRELELERRVARRTQDLERENADLRRQLAEQQRALTELTRAQEDVNQSRKMEAIGKLAGGIAHDFNNLLTVIRGLCDLLIRQTRRGAPAAAMLQNMFAIDYAALRAEQLVRQLLAFSRKQVPNPRRVDVNERLRNLRPLINRLIGDDVEVLMRTSLTPAIVRFDPCQLDQVILNLIANARDAMPHGGRLSISTLTVPTSDDRSKLVMRFEDTGTGMTPETMGHIFEPFFTTKALGSGTGFGLSMVHGIVTQSGGQVRVESTIGKGTWFEIHLPEEIGPADCAEQALDHSSLLGGDERVLVVDNEPMVRAFVATTLRDAGYTVLEAVSASDAKERLERERDGIALLLTDVVMPEGSGPELAEWVCARDDRAAIIYMSGSTEVELLQSRRARPFSLLSKPLKASDLLSCVRNACDARSQA